MAGETGNDLETVEGLKKEVAELDSAFGASLKNEDDWRDECTDVIDVVREALPGREMPVSARRAVEILVVEFKKLRGW